MLNNTTIYFIWMFKTVASAEMFLRRENYHTIYFDKINTNVKRNPVMASLSWQKISDTCVRISFWKPYDILGKNIYQNDFS